MLALGCNFGIGEILYFVDCFGICIVDTESVLVRLSDLIVDRCLAVEYYLPVDSFCFGNFVDCCNHFVDNFAGRCMEYGLFVQLWFGLLIAVGCCSCYNAVFDIHCADRLDFHIDRFDHHIVFLFDLCIDWHFDFVDTDDSQFVKRNLGFDNLIAVAAVFAVVVEGKVAAAVVVVVGTELDSMLRIGS